MNYVPEEILEEILQYLSSTQLHNAMQVSKRWSETIFISSRLEKKMILDIYFNTTSKALEMSKCFSYKSINLTMDEIRNSQSSSPYTSVKKFDANVKEIFTILGNELETLKFENLVRLMPMLLLKTPNLTRLNLEKVDVDDRQLQSYPNEQLEQDSSRYEEQMAAMRQRRPRMRNGERVNPYMDLPINHFEQTRLLEQNRGIKEANLRDPELRAFRQLYVHEYHLARPIEEFPIIQPPRIRRFNTFRQYYPRYPNGNSQLLQVYPNVPVVVLQHLKFLEIKSVRKVLCWIEAPNLKTFIVHDASNCDGIKELLMTTEKLENLVMDHFVSAQFENHEKFTFELKKLKINCIKNSQLTCRNEGFVLNFMTFLLSQKQSLLDLSLTFHSVNPEIIKIFKCINENLKLSNFSINFNLNSPSYIFESENSECLTVLNNLKNIISNCEHVTSLDIKCNMHIDNELLNHLAMSMPNLKSLSINPFFTKVSSTTVFENLESLKITKLREGPHTATWYEIAMTSPNIKELTLVDEFFEISPMKLKMVLKNAKNLKVLNLTGLDRFVISEEFLKIFMDDKIKVWRINVHAKMTNEEFNEKMRILTRKSKIQTVLHQI